MNNAQPVIIIHGIHESKGEAREWMDALGEFLTEEIGGLCVLPYTYGWTPFLEVGFPCFGHLARRAHTRDFQSWVQRTMTELGLTKRPHLIAYSMGTDFAQRSMTMGRRKLFFDHVFYMGGVVSSRESFRNEWGHFQKLTNLYSLEDEVARVAPFGHCGYRGFMSAPPAENVEMKNYEHTDYQRLGPAWDAIAERLGA